MSQSDAHDPADEQQARAADISTYLHNQADQLAETADQLEAQASAAHTQAEAIAADADQMRDRAEHLHHQADKIDSASEA